MAGGCSRSPSKPGRPRFLQLYETTSAKSIAQSTRKSKADAKFPWSSPQKINNFSIFEIFILERKIKGGFAVLIAGKIGFGNRIDKNFYNFKAASRSNEG